MIVSVNRAHTRKHMRKQQTFILTGAACTNGGGSGGGGGGRAKTSRPHAEGEGEEVAGGDWEPRRRRSDWASMGFHKFRPEKRIWASKLSARESSSSSLSFCLSVMRWDFVVFSRSVFASILI